MSRKVIVGTDGKHFTLSTGEQSIYVKNIILNMKEGKAHIEFDDIPIEHIEISRNIDETNEDLQEIIAQEKEWEALLSVRSIWDKKHRHNS